MTNKIGGIIAKVYPDTIAWEIGLEAGDKILSINQTPLRDLIDLEFLWADEEVELLIQKANRDQEESIIIEKDYDEILGAEFTSAVFDGIKVCKNNCLFCFVDQMAPQMRPSLYMKDDDYRLSFLQGSFITMTNLTEADKQRIKEQRLSPLYVSVHSADPENRRMLVKNPQSVKIIEDMEELAQAGIEFHTQIVLCKGLNDGDYLDYSIEKLDSLGESVLSLAVVPVGITKFRKDQENFPDFTIDESQEIINKVHGWQKKIKSKRGYNFLYLADEFYLKGQMPFPAYEEYDDFPQLENGVGLSRIFIDEYEEIKESLPKKLDEPVKKILISGRSPEAFLQEIIDDLNETENLDLDFRALDNDFFGSRVTVTGLLTGHDLLLGLADLAAGSQLLIPDIMLRDGEDTFLDGKKISQIEEELKIKIEKFDSTFAGLSENIFYKEGGKKNETIGCNRWPAKCGQVYPI